MCVISPPYLSYFVFKSFIHIFEIYDVFGDIKFKLGALRLVILVCDLAIVVDHTSNIAMIYKNSISYKRFVLPSLTQLFNIPNTFTPNQHYHIKSP